MRIYVEHINTEGESAELEYETLTVKIMRISAERGSHIGELLGTYRDITLSKNGWDLVPKKDRPKYRLYREKIAMTREQIVALTNAFGVRRTEELKSMEVTALYQNSSHCPNFIGFIRPQDEVILEK